MDNDNLKTIVFVGRSGSGKGTQAKLLRDFIYSKSKDEVKIVGMGEIFRKFFEEDFYSSRLAKDVTIKEGKFQPDFLTDALFVCHAVKIFEENNIILFDGYPRNPNQLATFKDLLIYLHRKRATVIDLVVSRESVKERMLKRARKDDHDKAIEERLDEYEEFSSPMIENIKKDEYFNYIEINGESEVEVIHKNIINKLNI